jgi:hypothetical protein
VSSRPSKRPRLSGPNIMMAVSNKHADEWASTRPDADAVVDPVLRHIRDDWCHKDEASYNYVMNWMALLVQRPEVLPGVALVIQGKQGAGKSVVIHKLGEIVGELQFKRARDLDMMFTGALENRLLLFMDDADFSRRPRAMTRLKTVITEPTLRIETKSGLGEAAPVAPNFVHLILTSNDDHVLRSERRMFVLKAASKYSGCETPESKLYHDRLRGVPAIALAHVLYNRDLGNFQPRQFPETLTVAQQPEQQEPSLSSTAAWWNECLHNGYVDPKAAQDETSARWPTECLKSDLFKLYRYRYKADQRAPTPEARFWPEMFSFLGGRAQEYRPSGGGRVVRLRSLDECRTIFSKLHDVPAGAAVDEPKSAGSAAP